MSGIRWTAFYKNGDSVEQGTETDWLDVDQESLVRIKITNEDLSKHVVFSADERMMLFRRRLNDNGDCWLLVDRMRMRGKEIYHDIHFLDSELNVYRMEHYNEQHPFFYSPQLTEQEWEFLQNNTN